MTFQFRQLAPLVSSPDSQVLFSIRPFSPASSSLEGRVVFIDSTEDYYVCGLLVEPLGSQTVDFFGSSYLPSLGESFLIELPRWNRGARVQDFTWPSKRETCLIPFHWRYRRFFTLGRLNNYNISLGFNRRRYYIRPQRFVFPLGWKKQFSYPTRGTQFLFLPRNLHRTLFRTKTVGFTPAAYLFSSLLSVSFHPFLRLEVLTFNSLAIGSFLVSLGFRLLFLSKLIKNCTIRRLRKRAKKNLAKLMFAWSAVSVARASFLPALNPLFFNSTQALFALPTTSFGLYLQSAILLGKNLFRVSRTGLFYRKPFVCRYKPVEAWLINSKRYSPLVSVAPLRRPKRRFRLLRKRSGFRKSSYNRSF